MEVAMTVLAQASEEPSGIDLILPAIDELLWGAVAFAIAFFVLSKFAFPLIRKSIEDRENKIQSDLEGAEEAKGEAKKELDEYRQQLAEARSEANKIVEQDHRVWIAGLGDEGGGGSWVAGAMKEFVQPDSGEIAKFERE